MIQETWLKPDKFSDEDITIPGYFIARKDRLVGEHGGILAYYRHDLFVTLLENTACKDFESFWLRIQSGDTVLFIANVYRPPSNDSSIFDALAADVETFQSIVKKSRVLLVGDFNCHHSTWLGSKDIHGHPKTNDAGNACFSFCQTSGLKNLVSGNTFLRNVGNAMSSLDLVLTDTPDFVKKVSLDSAIGSSPHSRIAVLLNLSPKVQKSYSKISWQYHRANWEEMKECLRSSDWDTKNGVNNRWEKLKNNIKLAMKSFIPAKMIIRKANDQPWFTDNCAVACTKKEKAWKVFKRNPTEENKTAYNQVIKDTKLIYSQAQLHYAENIKKKLADNAADPRVWWRIVKHISGDGGHSDIPTLQHKGCTYETATEKAEILKELFVSKSTIEDDGIVPPLLPNLADKSISKIKIRARVVEMKLKHLKTSKATGPDGIPARVLRECAEVLSKPLASLFSASMSAGIVPNDWKCAHVVPIYKADGKSNQNNYRPISLLPIISKVMESIVNDHLCKHLFGLRLISNHQYGFHPNHSTLDLLSSTTQKWTDALDKGQEVKVVALDISRAFDSVWHNGLLTKLMSFGIGGCLYRWLRDFLHARSLKVIINGQESTVGYFNAGVPQGSILGPTLFLVFINDLANAVTSQVNMFADDTTISAIVPTTKDRGKVTECLNNDLKSIGRWANDWIVNFNAKKTQLLNISRKSEQDVSNVCFLNETLKSTDFIKVLGIHITKTLDWSTHVDKLAKRSGQRLGILRKAKSFLDPTGLSALFKTRVRSVMEYCSPIWQSAPKVVLNKLDIIQSKACKVIDKSESVIPQLNINSLKQRREVAGLSQIHRIVSGVAPPSVCQLLPPFVEPTRISRQVIQSHHMQIKINKSRTEHHKNSFIPKFVRIWNLLPCECIYDHKGSLLNLQSFKVKVNRWLLDSI